MTLAKEDLSSVCKADAKNRDARAVLAKVNEALQADMGAMIELKLQLAEANARNEGQ